VLTCPACRSRIRASRVRMSRLCPVRESFALVSVSVCLPVPFGLLVLSIGVVAVPGCVYVAVLALVFVGIGFGWGLGLSRTWYDRTCGCALFCLGYVVIVVGIRVIAVAITSHVVSAGLWDSGSFGDVSGCVSGW
jgi:hypothetical protein